MLDAISDTGVLLVELTDRKGDVEFSQIRSDDAAIGKMGAEHLLERGFKRFGYCGYKGEAWSKRREESFVKTIDQKSSGFCLITLPGKVGTHDWEDEQRCIIEWLQTLTPPFAVMACNDIRGRQIIDACSELDLAVPEQVVVVGVDDDELLCRMCSPPLSSVIPNARCC